LLHPQLINLESPKYLRNRIIAEYPDHYFIKLPDNIAQYTTADGVHLTI